MRQLKFRAWNGLSMHYFNFEEVYHKAATSGGLCTGLYFQGEPIMQYVGITDRNNKEIYEGDIVKMTWERLAKNGNIELCGSITIIKWNEEFAGFYPFYLEATQYEIIGNIYENPELLKEI